MRIRRGERLDALADRLPPLLTCPLLPAPQFFVAWKRCRNTLGERGRQRIDGRRERHDLAPAALRRRNVSGFEVRLEAHDEFLEFLNAGAPRFALALRQRSGTRERRVEASL